MLHRFEVISHRSAMYRSGGRRGGTGCTSLAAACWWVASLLVCVLGSRTARGQATPQFNRDIRPILAENCLACHGVDSAARAADLRLDRREDALDHGAIAPGDADSSELMSRILSDDPHMVMPPPESKKQLTDDQKDILRSWINAGAEYQSHWSFIAPQRPALPEVKDESWVRNAIDRFTLDRIEAEGLTPAPEAAPHALFRRLHFDITGLPPQPDDLVEFVSDYQQRKDLALSDWIDRLMASSAWGEHRGRYWLDAARYADTHGVHFDNYREIWPYRDWVIRAFNANQPFDEFTVEQLAGDLLPDPENDQLIATGFQRCNITTNEGGTIAEENLANYAADRVQTFGWVFLGLTTNCAQCHDHKFDPISARDYYSLAAFFRNTKAPALDGNVKDGKGPVLVTPSQQDRPRWDALPSDITAAEAKRDERRVVARPAFESWLASINSDQLDETLPSEGLVVHSPLDEGNGEEVRNTANSAESFVSTGVVDWIPGGKLGAAPRIKPGSSFDLGQHGDYEKDQPFSCGVWINPSNMDGAASIVARMDKKARHRGWDLWLNKGALAVHMVDSWDGNALKVTTAEGVVQTDQWQHVLFTYDGSGKPEGLKLFVDGRSLPLKVPVDKLRPDASIRTTTPLRIGQRSEGDVFAGGAVQDFRLFDRTLSPQEVQAITYSGQVQTLLKTPPAERDPADLEAAFDNYLALHDPDFPSLTKQVDDLLAEQAAIRERSPITHIQQEREDSKPMAHILMRGEYDQLGEQVAASTPEFLHALPKGAPNNRLGLAMWVVDPANPLTARVTVNRFWQEVFGQGLVTTTEDFGVSGAMPSHPELLDWLAIDFREHGWDVKRLFKQMLMSATYRQSAKTTPEKLEVDPPNFLLSRGPRFRLDAEMVRDYVLEVSGLLSRRMYGPGVKPYQPGEIWSNVGVPGGNTRKYRQDHGEDLYRRTVYTFWKRMAPPPNLEAFNAPSREVCTVRRERTNTPLQALVTLNDPQFVEASRRMAEHALAEEGDDAVTLRHIALRMLGRELTVDEQAILVGAKQEFLHYYQANPDDAQALVAVGEATANPDLDVATLAAWSMVASQVLSLDEALNK